MTNQSQINSNSWSLAWDSSLPNAIFYVYQNGVLSYSTTMKTGSFRIPQGRRLLVEVLDDKDQKPTEVYSGVINIGWYSTDNTKSYLIEKLSDGNWVVAGSVIETGLWWYNWMSDLLNDCESYSFKVTPIGTNGNKGNSIVFVGFMVRNPNEPNLNIVMNNDTTITFS